MLAQLWRLIRERDKTPPAATLLPLWDVVDDAIVTSYGTVLRVAEISGIDVKHASDVKLTALQDSISELLRKDLGQDIVLQTVLISGCDDLSDLPSSVADTDHPALREQYRDRHAFLRAANMRRARLYLAVGTYRRLAAQEFSARGNAALRRAFELAKKQMTVVALALQNAQIRVRELTTSEILNLLHEELNPDHPERLPIVRREGASHESSGIPRSVREQLFETPIRWGSNHVQIGTRYAKVLMLRGAPERTHGAYLAEALSFAFDFRLSSTVVVPNQGAIKRSVWLLDTLDYHRQKMSTDATEIRVKREKAVAEEEQRARTEQRYAQVAIKAVVYGQTPQELARHAHEFISRMKALGLGFVEEFDAHDREFFKTLPGLVVEEDRWRRVLTHTAADFVQIASPANGEARQLLIAKTQSNHRFAIDPVAPYLINHNWLIFGSSGAGKSVVTNMLLSNVALRGPSKGHVIVVDVVGPNESSYKPLTEMLGGKYVHLCDPGSHEMALNPWLPHAIALGEDGRLRPEANTLVFLASSLILGLDDSQEGELSRAILQEGITQTYARITDRTPVYRDLYQTLGEMGSAPGVDQERLRNLRTLLRAFLSSPYERLLGRDSELDLDSEFIVFDLFGIQNYPDPIQAAIAYCVVDAVRQRVLQSTRRDYVILDEVAQLLTHQKMRRMVEELFSTARKYNTSVWAVTQMYQSYVRSAVADIVRGNAVGQLLLSHANDRASRELVIRDFGMGEEEARVFSALRTKKGEYSEILYRCVTERQDALGKADKVDLFATLRLELSPLDLQIVTTDPLDRERKRHVMQEHPEWSLRDVLRHLAYGEKPNVGRAA